jgi:uncharacterized membrane protein
MPLRLESPVRISSRDGGCRHKRETNNGPDVAATRRGEVDDWARQRRDEGGSIMPSTLVVLKFESSDGAEKGLALAARLHQDHLLELQDAATVTWPNGKRKPKTRHVGDLTCAGAWDGAFWGLLLGLIFFVPFLGAAFGAAVGALGGHFADYGIGKDFLEQVRRKVTEGSSALFLLVGQVTTDKVIEAFKTAPKFEVIASNLSKEQEEKLKEAFAH